MKKVRLRFIDAMFSQYGQLSRSFLVDIFEISELTATRDLKEYFEIQKEVLYDRSTKIFQSTGDFKRVLVQNPVEFLDAIKIAYQVDFGHIQVTTFGVKK